MSLNPIQLAVNGTLMRGLALNGNLTQIGGTFLREAQTAPCYRLWSIRDIHPGMIRTSQGGSAIALEIWEIPALGLSQLLLQEPPGLSVGRILLSDQTEVLGILAEPYLCEGQTEITAWGGWRAYIESLTKNSKS
ncbi:glutamyl-tRNA amidotransferase [Synechococcus sp. Nb3U1]|uniref:allophanate hydrolase-related protein n=1 Tax=Synechococcus sp. Nb3U1 TaxID=1914529 RepID=UPI001F25C1D5|nr:glutamyl-tRNA amidotransferase [Synechococcus sp. Nb3U1]MCF2971889.1 glutamyl-tRNA amidotransferase [Synechococcus sp. Nb3U1]